MFLTVARITCSALASSLGPATRRSARPESTAPARLSNASTAPSWSIVRMLLVSSSCRPPSASVSRTPSLAFELLPAFVGNRWRVRRHDPAGDDEVDGRSLISALLLTKREPRSKRGAFRPLSDLQKGRFPPSLGSSSQQSYVGRSRRRGNLRAFPAVIDPHRSDLAMIASISVFGSVTPAAKPWSM